MTALKQLNAIIFTALALGSGMGELRANDNLDDFVPPEYFDLAKVDLDQVFGKPGESKVLTQSKCRGGLRIGDTLGRQFIESVKPSCNELLFPLKEGFDNEWSVPKYDFSKATDASTVCSYMGFAYAVEQTVLNTAKNCGKLLDDTFKLSVQLEYNRCYKIAATEAVKLNVSFGQGSGFITGKYVVIPSDSAEWDEFLASMVTIVNGEGQREVSGYLQVACNLGTSHAVRNQSPINFFDDKQDESTPPKSKS